MSLSNLVADSFEKDYYNAFSAAESQLKNTEYIDQEVLIPAINELRYAGYAYTF
jgi:hypothetical protein